MASIVRYGPYQYRAQIRRKGFQPQVKTFATKEDAIIWASTLETEMRRGVFLDRKEAERTTLAEALDRYGREVSSIKKSEKRELQRIALLKREPIAGRSLAEIRGTDMAAWRDNSLKVRGGNSTRLYLALISHLYTICRKEWGMEYLDNPVKAIRPPKTAKARERRLHPGEEKLLLQHAPPIMRAWIIFAIETAMRRAEMAGLRRQHIRGRVASLGDTKNGSARAVPLSTRALEALAALPARIDGRIFGLSQQGVTRHFHNICQKAGIEDLRLHDLRREATSRLFERGLSLPEVASITGHKTWAMLKRYTEMRAEELAAKLG